MTIGIGAGGIAGLAIEQLPPPVQATATTSTSGGTLPTASLYRYYVTAINDNGETTVSNEQSVTTGAGATNSNTVNWAAVTGATGYRIYRTAAAGASGSELFLVAVGVVVTYIDTGSLSPAGAYPLTNTAVTPGTYVAPTKFFPFLSESVNSTNETVWRRPIRQSADIIGAVAGNYHPEGDLSMEAMEDVLIYFLWANRTTIVKTGSAPDFTYTITPTSAAVANKTMSLTIVRNGIVFGYTGICTSNFNFTIEEGLLNFGTSLMGRDEAVQAVPIPTWPTTVPFGAGQYTIEIPTGSTVLDTDTFEFSVEDNATPQFRLKSTGRGAQFIQYGERSSTMTMDRDFESRVDYDNFKNVTAQSVTLTASKGANNSVSIVAPVAIKDTFEVNLSGQGDLVRASIAYQNVIDGTGKSWQLVIKTQEDIIP